MLRLSIISLIFPKLRSPRITLLSGTTLNTPACALLRTLLTPMLKVTLPLLLLDFIMTSYPILVIVPMHGDFLLPFLLVISMLGLVPSKTILPSS